MKFFAAITLAVLNGLAAAVSLTNSNYDVKAGQTFTLKWTNATGAVTITLKNGASTNLKTVETIASGQTGDSYDWTPKSSLATDTYAFEIADSTGSNYSPQFQYEGSASASTAISTATSASSVSSAASSAASSVSSSSSASESKSSTTTTASSSMTTTVSASSSASKTSTTASSKTASSSSTSSSTNTPNTNNAGGLVAPLALALLAGVVAL